MHIPPPAASSWPPSPPLQPPHVGADPAHRRACPGSCSNQPPMAPSKPRRADSRRRAAQRRQRRPEHGDSLHRRDLSQEAAQPGGRRRRRAQDRRRPRPASQPERLRIRCSKIASSRSCRASAIPIRIARTSSRWTSGTPPAPALSDRTARLARPGVRRPSRGVRHGRPTRPRCTWARKSSRWPWPPATCLRPSIRSLDQFSSKRAATTQRRDRDRSRRQPPRGRQQRPAQVRADAHDLRPGSQPADRSVRPELQDDRRTIPARRWPRS